jgi:RNA polymerase sigma-B factor
MENEQLLAAYNQTGSSATLDEIVRRNQNLLHHILKRFAYASDPYEDLLQVANLGLIKAAQRFDAERGVRFSTYATAIVDGELRHHLRDSLLMRQPRWVKKVYREIQAKSNELMHKLGRPPEVAELAQALNINEAGILEVMSQYARIDLHSRNEPFAPGELDEGADPRMVHSLRQESFALPIEDRIALYDALDKLSDAEEGVAGVNQSARQAQAAARAARLLDGRSSPAQADRGRVGSRRKVPRHSAERDV